MKETPKSLQEEVERRYVLIDEIERDDYDDFDGINSDLKLARLTFIEGATSDFVSQERDAFAMGFGEWTHKNFSTKKIGAFTDWYSYDDIFKKNLSDKNKYTTSQLLSKYKEHLEAEK